MQPGAVQQLCLFHSRNRLQLDLPIVGAWGMIKKHLYCQLKPFHWSVFKTTLQCTSFIIWSFAFDRWSLSRVIPSILACRFKTSMSWKRKKNKGYNIKELTQGGLLFLWRERSSHCWNYSPFCVATHQRKWFLRPRNWYTVAFRAFLHDYLYRTFIKS